MGATKFNGAPHSRSAVTKVRIPITPPLGSEIEAPAKRGRRSKSFPAAEAIAAGAESSQLDEFRTGSRSSRCQIQNSLAMLEVCWD